jgi:signal transduction histidine kinase/putative methionine-R-sulfoxide reductase with GAF domain
VGPSDPFLDRLAELSLLCEAARALDASLDLQRVAEAATRVPAVAVRARVAVLRLLDDDGALVPAARVDAGLAVEQPAEARLAQRLARDRRALLIPDLQADPDVGGPDQPPCPAAGIPLVADAALVGTLILCGCQGEGREGTGRFVERDLRVLVALGERIARALQHARRYADAEQRAAQLALLREIGQAIAARLDLPAVLEAVVSGTMRLLKTEHVQIVLWDEAEQRLRFGAAAGPEAERVQRQAFELGVGVNGVVAASREAMILNDYQSSTHALAEFPDIVATITTPLLFGDRLLGVLHSHTTTASRRFTRDDLRLMQALATHAAIAIENARLFREAEQLGQANVLKLRQISILNEIGNAMRGTMHLDELLHVVLTGATLGGGLGFNRAMLLLVDDERRILRGRMGVGPASGEDAARIWGALASDVRPLRDVIAERAAEYLREAEDSPFDRLARGLEIPLDREDCVLARTVREGRPFLTRGVRADPRLRLEWGARLDVDEFASAPLLAKGKVVGVVVVDNRFNGKPITEADLDLLSVFASQAGLAVEHARMYARLEDAHREVQRTHYQLVRHERLAALGEMAAHVVHEIRNPLVAIGGFARRLAQRLAGREPEGVYAQVIAREVDRLERIVQDVRGMSRDASLNLSDTDLHVLLQECLVLVAERLALHGVVLRTQLADRAPVLTLDAVRVKQAILNLLTNALEAMPSGGILTLRTDILRADGVRGESGSTHRLYPGEWAVVSIRDTGGGIPLEVVEEIYKPFFTTKEVGTGLGLALVRRIVRSHGGRLEMDNRPGEGVTFRIYLPAKVGG